jgi:hypothetical protein
MLYRLSALAEEDLDEIWSYVAEEVDVLPVARSRQARKARRS